MTWDKYENHLRIKMQFVFDFPQQHDTYNRLTAIPSQVSH